jgi:CubicO group peptidase (beta-lactamase class C family)
MHDTMFGPPAALIPRVAPTEFDEASGKILRGIVHDPTARYMGGVAGHAGPLTTAGDLMIYADMLLGNGQRAGVRLLSPLIVKEFTSPATPANQPILSAWLRY